MLAINPLLQHPYHLRQSISIMPTGYAKRLLLVATTLDFLGYLAY